MKPTSSSRKHGAPCVAPGRVLVAEDNDEMRALLANTMRRDGYEVVEASNGWQLLNQLAVHMHQSRGANWVDLVISDVRMPGPGGLDVLAGMRWAGLPVPVVLISAFADPEVREEANRLGAVAVLGKPFAMDELRVIVLRQLT